MPYKAIYSRYYVTEEKEFATLKEAENYLAAGNEYGQLFPIAVIDRDENKAWLAKSYSFNGPPDYRKYIGDATIEGEFECNMDLP